MSNPLVAERQDSTQIYTGIGIIESAADIYHGVENGSWIEGGLGVVGTGLEMLSLGLDPIGTLGQYAISWLIEQIRPLREGLNWLAGDADQIAAYAATWKNVSNAVNNAGQEFRSEVTRGTSGWQGAAADAYRANVSAQSEHIIAAATAAQTISTVVEVTGMLVGAVRGIVRDLVAECISTLLLRIPQWLAEEGLTLGLATPHVIASAGALIAKWVNRINDFITKLVRSLEKLRPILGRLVEIWEKIKSALARLRTRPGTPSTPHAPDPVHMSTPDTPSPTTPSGSTTPSGTTTPSGSTTPSGTTTPGGTTTPSGTTTTTPHPTGTDTPGATTPTGTTRTDPTPTKTDPTPTDTDPMPPRSTRDYDSTGKTIPTKDIPHPHADLLDENLLKEAAKNPDRVTDALSPGLPKDHPVVQDMVPGHYDQYGGLGKDGWETQYHTGEVDARGNPKLNWPDPQTHPDGFSSPEARNPIVMTPGQQFDRFGPGFGQFGSPVGTGFPERALPPSSLEAGYHRYEVVKPIPAWEGSIAPAMGQPGGGTQYWLPHSIVDLVNAGYLKEIPL